MKDLKCYYFTFLVSFIIPCVFTVSFDAFSVDTANSVVMTIKFVGCPMFCLLVSKKTDLAMFPFEFKNPISWV